jgi:hypothetical protein
MTEQANIVISIPAYISNDAADDSITITDPISGIKAIVLTTGYYEFQLNDATGDGTEATPFHLLKELADGSTTKWHYRITSDGKLAIGYSGTGSATFVFENSHIQNLCGSTSSTLTFSGAGEQIMTYPVYGLLISRNREGDGSWRLDPGFNIHQITADNNVYGWSDDYNKYKRKFGLRFLPKDQSFKTSTQVGTPVYPVSSSTWNSSFNPLSYTAPFTAVNFLHNAKSRKLKMHLGSLPYNGTDEYFIVYQTPESIQRTNRFAPSLRANYERLLTLEDFEVLLSTGDTGEASYATGSLAVYFAPSDLSGLQLWLRSDDLVQSGGLVSQVNDKSGNARHAVQAFTSNQPYYFASGGPNNLPYWEGFSAPSSGRYLLAGADGDFDFMHNGTDWTLIYIAAGPTNNSCLIMGTQQASAINAGFSVWEYTSPGVQLYMGNNVTTVISKTQTTGFNSGSWNTAILKYTDSATPALSGVLNTTIEITANKAATPTATSSGRKFGVGSSGTGQFSSNTKFAEVIVYNRTLTAGEISQIQDYIFARYVATPADLPGLSAWWQADDVVLSASKITQFNDKSGNGRHATNNNATYQVTQSVDAAYNGKIVAITNGSPNQVYTSPSFTASQPLTIFAVGNGNGTDWETFIDSNNVNRVIFRKDPTNYFAVYGGTANVTVASVNVKTNPGIGWTEFNGAASKGNVNSNTAITLASNPGTNSLTEPILFVGNSNGYPLGNGAKFAATLVFNRQLSTTERTFVLSYFSSYYGITVSGI